MPFGYVRREEVEVERVARAAAETEARLLRERVAALETSIAGQRSTFEHQLQAERERYTDTLDRLIPKRETVAAEEGQGRRLFTSEMARRMPAVGKGDMRRRRAEVSHLEAEEREAETGETQRRRAESLTDEERRSQGLTPRETERVDELLGIPAEAFPRDEETQPEAA